MMALLQENSLLKQDKLRQEECIAKLNGIINHNNEALFDIQKENAILAEKMIKDTDSIEQLEKIKTNLQEKIALIERENKEQVEVNTSIINKCEQLQSVVEEQNKILLDENGKRIVDVKHYLAETKKVLAEQNEDIRKKKEEIERLQGTICRLSINLNQKQKEFVELDDALLMQEVGIYKPLYSFAHSSDYKERLEECRNKQKQMVREGTAAICSSEWMANGSIALGKKMIGDRIKQIVLMFNTECENAIDKVRYNNYESIKKRISRMFEKLNKLNEAQHIGISDNYLKLKYEELALAFECAMKVQEEKEYIKEQREIERENAKVQKEIEEERKRIAKEKTHYENALQRLKEQLLETVLDPEKQTAIEERIADVNAELKDLEEALKQVDYRQANERAGYVYIISNIGAFGENVYKIGMTRRLDPMDRIDELSGAAVPFRYDVHALIFSADAPKLESALHNAFSDYRLNSINNRKEFFRVPLEEIERVVRENHDRSVDFQYIPAAEQYRQSKAIWEEEHRKYKSKIV